MNRILASLVALIAIALIWMLVRIDAPPRSGAASQEAATSAPQRDSGARLATDDAKRGAREEAARSIAPPPGLAKDAASVRVVSTTKLPLAFVELEVEPRTWERRDLVEGALALDRVHL